MEVHTGAILYVDPHQLAGMRVKDVPVIIEGHPTAAPGEGGMDRRITTSPWKRYRVDWGEGSFRPVSIKHPDAHGGIVIVPDPDTVVLVDNYTMTSGNRVREYSIIDELGWI
jgi:hypothetical protein